MKTITKKQAGVIYGNVKRGNITVPRGFVRAMYDTCGMSDYALRHESDRYREVARKCFLIIDFLFDGRYNAAQAIIDGAEYEDADRLDADMLDDGEIETVTDGAWWADALKLTA